MRNTIFPFTVGHFKCLAIKDGDENDFERNLLLVDTGEQQVLVDTGNGRDFESNRGRLLDRLREVGISPADIDVVILSHADWDHIGGAVAASGAVVFPRARYILARAEWDFWHSKAERLRPSDTFDEEFRQLSQRLPETRLAQLKDKLDLIDPQTEILPGIRSIAAPGHTPGYTVISISSGVDQLLYLGDLLYDPKDIEDPNWYSVYDFAPQQVVLTRNQIFDQAARERALLMAYHLDFPGLGYISRNGQGWRWQALETPN